MPMKYYRRPPLKTHIYIYFKEVGQKVVIYNIIIVGFCPSYILLKSSPELLPIRFIYILNINKNKPVKDQLKVIREDVLYTLNEVY